MASASPDMALVSLVTVSVGGIVLGFGPMVGVGITLGSNKSSQNRERRKTPVAREAGGVFQWKCGLNRE
jgi:hypothetical protein